MTAMSRIEKSPQRLTGRLMAFLLWTVFLVAVVELAFRVVVFPDYRSLIQDMYEPHPVFGHYNKPNLEVRRFSPMNYDVINHTNQLGQRGLDRDMERELRGLWVAGGSNTFGGYVGDDEAYTRRLRGLGFWAANLASEGHDMAMQALVIRDLAAQGYRPRAVILALTFFNAVQDYGDRLGYLTRPLGGVAPVAETRRSEDPAASRLVRAVKGLWSLVPTSFMALRARFIKNSAVYGWLKVGVMGIPALREWTLRLGLRADLDLVHKNSLDLLRPLVPENPATRLIASTAGYVAALKAIVRESLGVPFGVVLLPNHHQIYPQRFERFVQHFGLQGQGLDPVPPIDALAANLRGRGIPVLDTLPALRRANTRMLVFPDDAHLNAEGHAVVARAVAQWLVHDLHVTPER